MTVNTLADKPESRCAEYSHGTLAHNAIGSACTACECGRFRVAAAAPAYPPAMLEAALALLAEGLTPEEMESDPLLARFAAPMRYVLADAAARSAAAAVTGLDRGRRSR